MIDLALEYIRKELRDYLGVDDTEVFIDHAYMLKENSDKKGVYVSLVNVEEENTLKNTSHYTRVDNQSHYQEPPVFLNLYLIMACNFGIYSTCLIHLSKIIEFFQSKRAFSAENQSITNPFPEELEKLIFDLYNLNLEQMNHLWGINGGTFYPAVLYKMRMVKIKRGSTSPAPEITRIQVDTGER